MRAEEGAGGGEQQAASAGGIVAEGSVRIDDDPQSDLRATLLVVDGRVTLKSRAVELGSWILSSVSITRADERRFDLSLDGEVIGFFPDDPTRFAALEIHSTPRKKGLRRRVASARTAEAHKARAERAKRKEARRAAKQARTQTRRAARASRAEQRAEKAEERKARRAAKAARAETRRIARGEKATAREAKQRARAEARKLANQEKAAAREAKRWERANRPHPVRDRIAAAASSSFRRRAARRARTALARGRWRARLALYWAMDELRQIDGFPFNRIPIVDDEKKREPGHVHSFTAHTAPAGIIREICACGKIRIASRPIQLKGPAHLRDRERKRSE